MAHVDVNEQEGHVSTGGKDLEQAQPESPKQTSWQSEAPAPAYFPIGNVIALADDEKDDGSQSVIEGFSRYVLDSGVLLLGIDNADLLEAFLSEATACSAMAKFVNGDDATFVLEMQSPLRPPGIEEDGDLEAMFVASDVTFAVFAEIPPSVFDAVSSEAQVTYLLFTKNAEGDLKDGEDMSMASQLIINKFSPAQPLQSMILEKLREVEMKLSESQDEEKMPDVTLEPITEIRQWLDGLGVAEKEAIIRSFSKQNYDVNLPVHLKNNQRITRKLLRQLRVWKDDIGFVVRRKRPSGRLTTVQQEFTFWNAKLSALEQVETELRTVGVCASILVLIQNNKRVQARAFLNAVQVTQTLREVQQSNELLATFPIKALKNSSTVQDIIRSVSDIFQHLDAFTSKANLPPARIANVARTAARDVGDRLRDVLSRNVMTMKYSVFVQRTASTDRLFFNFANKYTKLRSDLRQRELLDNKQRSFSGTWHRDQETELNALQKRVESIKKIRKGHAEIEKVIENAFVDGGDQGMLQEKLNKIVDAFNVFRRLDALQASAFEWEQCVDEYNGKIEEVENEFQRVIRREVENASTPTEMFRVCEKYHSLFARDRIRDVVWEFQEEIIEHVQEEVNLLQNRYRKDYNLMPTSQLSELRDIPEVSGQVIWCRQLKRQLDQHERRLEVVLGKDWKIRSNAKDLAEQMTTFAKRLNPIQLVRKWETEAKSMPNFDDQAHIFKIDSGVNKSLSLNVAFDENYVKMMKEVRCLLSLGIRIDISLRLSCIDVKQKHPVSVKLKEAVSIFTRTCRGIEQYIAAASKSVFEELQDDEFEEKDESTMDVSKSLISQLAILVDEFKNKCQQTILQGVQHRWSHHEKQLNKYVATLSKCTILLQDKTQRAYDVSHECDKTLQELLICPVIRECITEKMAKIQSMVNMLDNGGFYGVPYWTAILNQKLERILLRRVDEILDEWIKTLDEDWDVMDLRVDDNDNDNERNIFRRKEPIKHTIRIHNNQLQVQPALSEAKVRLGRDLQSLLSMLVNQPRLKSDLAPFEQRSHRRSATQHTFRSILQYINTRKIIACYRKIEEITTAATQYSNMWLSHQALYDIDLNEVFESLGDDIGKWKQLLMEMKEAAVRSFVDAETEKCFGPIVISYGAVREKIEEKRRTLRQETFRALKVRLGTLLRDLHKRAMRGKQELEDIAFDTSTTKKFVSAITQLLSLKEESAGWMKVWSEYEEAEKLLVANRYYLGTAWMHASRIKSVLNDYFYVLNMRWNEVKEEASVIGSQLQQENDRISDAVIKLDEKWHTEKPIEIWASAWTDKEVVDWMRNYRDGVLRPCIEGFRANAANGRTLYMLSMMDGSSLTDCLHREMDIAPKNQNNLIHAMESLMFTHQEVYARLSWFEQEIKSMEENYADNKAAKRAMALIVDEDSEGPMGQNDVEMMMDSTKREIAGLKQVHKALIAEWQTLQRLGLRNFMRLDTRELGETLRAMEERLSKLPKRIRTYQAYHQFISLLSTKKKMCKGILGELKAGGIDTPILKEKHWKELFQLLRIKRDSSTSLVLDDLWSVDLLKFTNEIRALCLKAQGDESSEKQGAWMTVATSSDAGSAKIEANLSERENYSVTLPKLNAMEIRENSLEKEDSLLVVTERSESENGRNSSEHEDLSMIVTGSNDVELDDDAISRLSPIYKRPKDSISLLQLLAMRADDAAKFSA